MPWDSGKRTGRATNELHFPAVTTQVGTHFTLRGRAPVSMNWKSSAWPSPTKNLALALRGHESRQPSGDGRRAESNFTRSTMDSMAPKPGPAEYAKGSQEKPWVQFTFAKPCEIDRIRLSSNREDFLETDYLEGMNKVSFGPYKLEVQADDGTWKLVGCDEADDNNWTKKHASRARRIENDFTS